jgi:hypothetical protein
MLDRRRDLVVVENFYSSPEEVRKIALSMPFISENSDSYFERTGSYFPNGIIDVLQALVGCKIKVDENWLYPRTTDAQNPKTYNGTFYRVAKGRRPPTHVHHDHHDYTAIVYLSPDCPPENGTMFYESRLSRGRSTAYPITVGGDDLMRSYGGDPSMWTCVDFVGNCYNRLVVFPSARYHGARIDASEDLDRLAHIFLFNVERQAGQRF